MKLLDKLLIPALILSAILLLIAGAVYLKNRNNQTANTEPVVEKDEFFIVEETPDLPEVTEDESSEDTGPDEEQIFRYLAIGNSMTIHRIDDLWWGEWGMAATTRDSDYVHRVQAGLNERFGTTSISICSFIPWEQAASGADRLSMLSEIEPYLNENLDLVTIQLGEGITDVTDLTSDYEKLITYIQAHAPNAQVMIIGNFWANADVDNAKQQAAANCNATFIDLSPLTTPENEAVFRSSVGAQVWGDDGQIHTIEDYTAGAHPNDQGMGWIATYILEALQTGENEINE